MSEPSEIWVVDTSSIIDVRRIVQSNAKQERVFGRLDTLVDKGQLVYPIQVVDELERHKASSGRDLPCEWVVRNKEKATRFGPQHDALKEIFKDRQVQRVVDPDRVRVVDEADPHVLALAFQLKSTHTVTVLTEETRDRDDKISMATACGLLKLYRLPMRAFLARQQIFGARSGTERSALQ